MSTTAAIVSVLGSSGRLLADAVLEWHPRTLPRRGRAVEDAAFLNRLLAEHGNDARSRAARAATVAAFSAPAEVPTSTSNGHGASSGSQSAIAPSTPTW